MMSIRYLMAGLSLCLMLNTLSGAVPEAPDSLSILLQEVAVTASPEMVKLSSNGISVKVHGTHLADAGTTLDLLGKLPFVSRSGRDIEIAGKGTPLVYIDGRRVRDVAELELIASSRIKSVDVVMSPGSRYATSANCVIRITTVAPAGEGFSFNDRTTAGYKRYMYLFQQTDFNYRWRGLDLFGTLNYENYRERPQYENTTVRYLKPDIVTLLNRGQEVAKYPVYHAKTGVNYAIKSHNGGVYYDFSFRPSSTSGISGTRRFIGSEFAETLDNISASETHNRQHLLSAYYTGGIGRWQLTANIDALWQFNDSRSDESETSSLNADRRFMTKNKVTNRLLAANVMASFPAWRGEARFGSEVNSIHRGDLYTGNMEYIADSDVNTAETTWALFAETSQAFGALSLVAGLRWEYTSSQYFQSGMRQEDRCRRYYNLAPSLSVDIPAGSVVTALSYARKISRPAFSQLSSAIRYIDRYMYESGNPGLRPVYRDYCSLSAKWRDVIVMLDYCSTKNYFMWQTSQYASDGEVTLLKMENMPRFSTISASVNYSPVFWGMWRLALTASVEKQDFTLTHCGVRLKLSRPIGIFLWNNALHLPWDLWLDLDISAQTAGNSENIYVKGRWKCDAGIYRSFGGDRWSVKLQLNDLFATWSESFITYDGLSRVAADKIYDRRDLSVTVRYNFNSARSRYKGSGAGNIEKSRF